MGPVVRSRRATQGGKQAETVPSDSLPNLPYHERYDIRVGAPAYRPAHHSEAPGPPVRGHPLPAGSGPGDGILHPPPPPV